MLSVASEFEDCDFGDLRLSKRLESLSTKIVDNPEDSINASCGSAAESKAAYRFLQNDSVSAKRILEGHTKSTLQRVSELDEDILVIQDTTDLVFTNFPSIKSLGEMQKPSGYKSGVRGIYLHNSIAVSKSGVPLGLLKQIFYTSEEYRQKRNSTEINSPGSHKSHPIEKKKSYRWVEHLSDTQELMPTPKNKVIHVADRECDIFEFLQSCKDFGAHFVVRSMVDRRTQEGPRAKDTGTIQKALNQAQVMGRIKVQKQKNEIPCEVRATTVELCPPQRSLEAKSFPLLQLKLNVVEVRGEDDLGHKLHWRLLTNLTCDSYSDILEVIEIYRLRWSIECFHRVLKSGFGVEKARLGHRTRIENLTSILSVAAWYIFWLYRFGRVNPGLAAKNLFDEDTIKVLKISAKKLKVPLKGTLTIGQGVLIMARLGGFKGRNGDGEPGMISIWKGWKKTCERAEFMEELAYG